MIKAIFWNARGAGNDEFKSAVIDLVKQNNIYILVSVSQKFNLARLVVLHYFYFFLSEVLY